MCRYYVTERSWLTLTGTVKAPITLNKKTLKNFRNISAEGEQTKNQIKNNISLTGNQLIGSINDILYTIYFLMP